MKYLILNEDNTYEYKEVKDIQQALLDELGMGYWPMTTIYNNLCILEDDLDMHGDMLNNIASLLAETEVYGKCILMPLEGLLDTKWKKTYLNYLEK